jgi:cytochrome P450
VFHSSVVVSERKMSEESPDHPIDRSWSRRKNTGRRTAAATQKLIARRRRGRRRRAATSMGYGAVARVVTAHSVRSRITTRSPCARESLRGWR